MTSVYLPNEQLILFKDEALPEDVFNDASATRSKLMAYFETNATDVSVYEHL